MKLIKYSLLVAAVLAGAIACAPASDNSNSGSGSNDASNCVLKCHESFLLIRGFWGVQNCSRLRRFYGLGMYHRTPWMPSRLQGPTL